MPQRLVLSAPGKVILHGEHAVVHGKRGVAMSLDLRTTLTLTRTNDTVTLHLPDVKIRECWSLASLQKLYSLLGITNSHDNVDCTHIENLKPESAKVIKDFLCISENSQSQRTLALLSFFHLYTSLLPQVEGFTIHVSSQIPTGAGLGSSAAYAVCLAGALLVLSGRVHPDAFKATTKDEVRLPAVALASKWTYSSEMIMHGNPSGIDNTTCSYGGVISFKDGHIDTLGTCGLQIMLVNTKVPRSTQALVASVKEKLEKFPEIINPILESMDALAERALSILRRLSKLKLNREDDPNIIPITSDEDCLAKELVLDEPSAAAAISSLYEELCVLLDMNHSLLTALGVSHPALERVVSVSSEHRLHAKLTGAGGGGFALVLLPRSRKAGCFSQCMESLRNLDYQVWMVDLGVPGLTLHSST